MAATQIANIVSPITFGEYFAQVSVLASRIIASGLAQQDPTLAALFPNSAGILANLPFWNPPADTAANASSDTIANVATPKALTAGQEVARRIDRNDIWSTTDLAVMVAGGDPIRSLLVNGGSQGAGLVTWMQEQQQRDLVATLTGILADNLANDSGDMVYTHGTTGTAAALVGGVVPETDKISPAAINAARLTLGDRGMNNPIFVCHSVVAAKLAEQNLLQKIDSSGRVLSEFESLAVQNLNYSQALGMTVFIDDKCPAVADGASRTMYTSYMAAPGFIRYTPLVPKVPIAFDRDEKAADGAGLEEVTVRMAYVMHPKGFASTVTTAQITAATLATAGSWDRRFSRKNVPFVAIRTNG